MKKLGKPSRLQKLDHLAEAIRHVKLRRHAVDVGAHIGLWSEVMARQFARLTAFEPLPENIRRWRERMAPYSNAELHGTALADHAGLANLIGKSHAKNYISFVDAGAVAVETLDDCAFADIDLLKIDAEGADALVIAGAHATILRCRPVVIVENMPIFQSRFGLSEDAVPSAMLALGARLVAELWRDSIYVFD